MEDSYINRVPGKTLLRLDNLRLRKSDLGLSSLVGLAVDPLSRTSSLNMSAASISSRIALGESASNTAWISPRGENREKVQNVSLLRFDEAGRAQNANCCHIDLMKPSWGDEKLRWQKNKNSRDIERRAMGEYGITPNAVEGQRRN